MLVRYMGSKERQMANQKDSQYLNHLLYFSNIQYFNNPSKLMKNIACNHSTLKKQGAKKQEWKKVFLKRQIRKEKASLLRYLGEEKDYSVAQSTVYGQSDSAQARIDYFDFSFIQQ